MLHDAIWMYAAAVELAIAAGDSVQNAMDYIPSINFTGMLCNINQLLCTYLSKQLHCAILCTSSVM